VIYFDPVLEELVSVPAVAFVFEFEVEVEVEVELIAPGNTAVEFEV
jgi:hypothetical protein